MFEMIVRWYKQRFSDPHAITLVMILVFGFVTIYFVGSLILPLLIAIVLAYLLEWPVAKISRIGIPRLLSVILVMLIFCGLMTLVFFVLAPTIGQQVQNLLREAPDMYTRGQEFLLTLPERYPELANIEMIDNVLKSAQAKVIGVGQTLLNNTLSSIMSLATLVVYMVLVPFLIFFLLKDKNIMLDTISNLLPENRKLANHVWQEMHQQISNYIRGKVSEIVIVGVVTYFIFIAFGLNYAVLLATIVGFSVLIPYIGAAAVTIPVAIVALSQWGIGPNFYWVMVAYFVMQILDGNVLSPLLFSDAVNLHPVSIIVAVLLFGGLWGFWGVFFAIPLATLVKAVWYVLFSGEVSVEEEQIPPQIEG